MPRGGTSAQGGSVPEAQLNQVQLHWDPQDKCLQQWWVWGLPFTEIVWFDAPGKACC